MKFVQLLVSAVLFAAPASALAHGPSVGPHGGPVADAGAYHAELIVQGSEVVLYVTDGSDKPVDVTGAKAEATILANKQTQKVVLEPAGDNTLKGKANLTETPDGIKVVTALTMPGQKPVQARFDVSRAGH
ncbi:hypothetical protein [Azospirillum agricola]|uniref:hypothetical protein n=1 Tax=Azospirillum agricola TaxID=1720247 RepID=UPI000A0F2099|nr:hypothetical protein [Azospirillum agricola]SMH61568.1 hypothetical protein SAMN02982994_5910 [Azospirillum lipoferum]